jgi:hypothetical protein
MAVKPPALSAGRHVTPQKYYFYFYVTAVTMKNTVFWDVTPY